MPFEKLRWIVLASLMAALTALGATLHIPLGPVPMVLTNLFVLLSGLLLGSRWGLAAMLVYLLMGAIGLPVFHGGKGGLAHILGPTGGYLLGFAAAAWVTGFVSERSRQSLAAQTAAVVLGSLAIYALGVPWLKTVTGMSWSKVLLAGMLPFLFGDALKAATAVVLARSLNPLVSRSMGAVGP